MEPWQLAASIAAVIVAAASFFVARRTDARAKKAESIKNLLGEKESVAFAALKLLSDGLPDDANERQLVISAVIQACVFERSDRARALLYRVIDLNRDKFGSEFLIAYKSLDDTFSSTDKFGLSSEQLDLSRGKKRISALKKVIDGKTAATPKAAPNPRKY